MMLNDPKLVARQLKILESLIAKCDIKLVKALNGSNVTVMLTAPGLKPPNKEFSICVKSGQARQQDLKQVAYALWDAKGREMLAFSTINSDSFPYAALLAKFKEATKNLSKDDWRKASQKYQAKERKRLLACALADFRVIAERLMRHGATQDEIQSVLNEVLVQSVHLA